MTRLTTTSQYDNAYTIPTNYAIDIGHSTNDIQPEDEQDPKEPVTMTSWSVILILVAIGLVCLALCFYRIYSEFKSSAAASRQNNNDTTGTSSSQSSSPSTAGKHSPRSRKRLVVDYLRDHSDNEMILQPGDVVSVDSVDVDCEMGICDQVVMGVDDEAPHLRHGAMDHADHSICTVIKTNRTQSPTMDPTMGKNTNEADSKDDTQVVLVAGDPSVVKGSQQGCPVQIVLDESCAICMEQYRVGDAILWSSAEKVKCPHIFHKHCFVEYLASYRGCGTPCPMCRQEYFCEDIFVGANNHDSFITVTTSVSSISSATENEGDSPNMPV